MGRLGMNPDLSHRYLAVRSGVGWFGFSGNVITPEYGAAVILGTCVTSAELEPRTPYPRKRITATAANSVWPPAVPE